MRVTTKLLPVLLLLACPGAQADPLCGDTGVWVQILGAGGPELDDGQAGSSFLVWNNGRARVLVDTGPGASAAFDRAGAKFEDLHVVLLSHLHADHAADFPAFLQGSIGLNRTEPLVVLGPDSDTDAFPDTETFVDRMIGPGGAFPSLQDFLTHKSSGGYRVRPRNVPATGNRRWAQFGNEELKASAIPVNHDAVPALAWRIDIGDMAVVFTGDFNNEKNLMPEFARDADALVATHAIVENSRGTLREQYALPSQLGRIAKQADARLLVLAHRMNRTRGRESQSRAEIEAQYDGYVLFANDMECWGL